jgi:hypothetical protein
MNTVTHAHTVTTEAFARALEAQLAAVSWLRGGKIKRSTAKSTGYDLFMELPLPHGGKAALCVACKKEMRPSVFLSLAERSFSPPGKPALVLPLLALPWVSPRMAELCLQHGWSWYDLAGNCHLDVPGLLRLERTGNKAEWTRPRSGANLGTSEAGRVLRVLLHTANTGRSWTQRELQSHIHPAVSLGLVNKVVRHLREEALIVAGKDGGIFVPDPRTLLFAWRDAYRFDKHQRMDYFTLLQGAKLRDALAAFALGTGGFAAYAGFSAAELQAPHVRQAKTWLYVREQDLSLFERKVEAKPVDSGGNLVLLLPNDEGVFYLTDRSADRMPCTNDVQTYVDLYHSAGRGEEAAEALLHQRLEVEWRKRGIQL